MSNKARAGRTPVPARKARPLSIFVAAIQLLFHLATAQAVEGVQSVAVTTFQRQGTPDPQPLAARKLELGRLEIARCANDPNFAERGLFTPTLGGGK